MGLEKFSHNRNIARKTNEQRQEQHCKDQLKKNIITKFKTTMIGAISVLEEEFGHLWGHGLDESELTEKQYENREKWQIARTEILNNGNNQLRAALQEIDQYTIKWNAYHIDFIVKPNQDK